MQPTVAGAAHHAGFDPDASSLTGEPE
jgi:hypothetical protein